MKPIFIMPKHFITLVICLFITGYSLWAQTVPLYDKSNTIDSIVGDTIMQQEEKIFHITESMPQFPGGEEALKQYLADSLRYPQELIDADITGRVVVEFVIDKDGNILIPQIVKSLHPVADAEAIRLIQNMPQWIPGTTQGKPTNVHYSIPLRFNRTKNEDAILQERLADVSPSFSDKKTTLREYLGWNRGGDAIKEHVEVRFVIRKDGRVTDVEVTKSLSPQADAQAIELIQNMPRWTPAQVGGNPVNIYYSTNVWFEKAASQKQLEVKEYPVKKRVIKEDIIMLPEFPGGPYEMANYIRVNMQYPPEAIENWIRGEVTVQFIVDEEGNISDVKAIKKLTPETDAEAVRLIASMPRWISGKKNGHRISMYQTLPIKFDFRHIKYIEKQ